jgi:MSHA biogenesis protein MshN
MSLINQVLQDLEARRGGIEGRRLPDEVRALPPQRRLVVWPWLLAGALASTAVAGYLLWPQALPPPRIVPPHPVLVPEPALPEAAVPLPQPAMVGLSPGGVAAVAARPATSPNNRRPVSPVAPPAPPNAAPRGDATDVAKAVRAPTPRERANGEYAKALAALKLGRQDQADVGLRAAIKEDPTWAPPRQALLASMLERQRLDEAEALLREGVERNPTQLDLAMQLAQLQVQRTNYSGALETLQRAAPQAGGSADYLGLEAAVLQRLNRHREAATAYEGALRLAPQNGVWWMGLAISLEAEGRISDAAAAYRRARDSGTLNAELTRFVEQKLKAN